MEDNAGIIVTAGASTREITTGTGIVTNSWIILLLLFSQFIIIEISTLVLYLVIEKFHPDKLKTLCKRFEEKGRLMPEGLNYINSWVDVPLTTCYQIMETDTVEKIHEWIGHWNDLASFEIIPVLTSAQAKEKVFQLND